MPFVKWLFGKQVILHHFGTYETDISAISCAGKGSDTTVVLFAHWTTSEASWCTFISLKRVDVIQCYQVPLQSLMELILEPIVK
jgi:hypothetical protein